VWKGFTSYLARFTADIITKYSNECTWSHIPQCASLRLSRRASTCSPFNLFVRTLVPNQTHVTRKVVENRHSYYFLNLRAGMFDSSQNSKTTFSADTRASFIYCMPLSTSSNPPLNLFIRLDLNCPLSTRPPKIEYLARRSAPGGECESD
jgi:hypothetical protein